MRNPEAAENRGQRGGDVARGFEAGTVLGLVERGLHGFQQERALVLDDDDGVEAGGEVGDLLGVQRPRHAQAEHADAVGGPEISQRLLDGQRRGAGADDAETVVFSLVEHAVEAPVPGVGAGALEADADAGRLQLMEGGAQGARRGGVPVGGRGRGHRRTVQSHGGRSVCDGGGDAQGRPQPGLAGHPRGMYAQLDHLGGVRGHQHGHADVREQPLGGRRHRRRLGEGIVADDGHRAAGRRRAREIRVPQGVHRAVEARSLSVPVAHDAVDALAQGAGAGGELGAGDRRGAEFLVDRRQVHDAEGCQQVLAAGELEVVAAQRGTLVAGDERGGLQSSGPIGQRTVAHRAHERLDARQVDGALVGGEAFGDDVAAPGVRAAGLVETIAGTVRRSAGGRSGVAALAVVAVVSGIVGSERGREHRGHGDHLSSFARVGAAGSSS